MNELKVINEQIVLGKEFKVYGDFENPLFLAKDVAEWIDNKNVSQMLNNVDEEEKGIYNVYTLGGNQEMWFLTEDGLYEVLMQSRKPIAKQFKKEVKKILKALRLGEVSLTPKLTKKQELQLAILNGDEVVRIGALKEYELLVTKPLIDKIEADKPLVEFSNAIAQSVDSIDIGTFAKLVKDEGIKMGRNKLFEFLRENKYLMKNNQPYQRYIDNGYFEIIEYNKKTPYGDKIFTKTLITGLGQIKIIETLRNKDK